MAAEEQPNGERHSDLAVMDANEYKQKRRLERILDAHDHVEEAAATAFEELAYGEITEGGKNIVLLQAVKRYIREVWQLLVEHHEDSDEDSMDYLYRSNVGQPLGRIERTRSDDVTFQGLADIVLADVTYRETWTETTRTRHGHVEETRHERQYTVPEDVSWNAYLLTNQFLSSEHDLELRFEELDDSLPTWGYEEVPDEDGTEVHSDAYDPEKNYGPTQEAADGDD